MSLNTRESVIYLFICLSIYHGNVLYTYVYVCCYLYFYRVVVLYSFTLDTNKLWNWPRSLCSAIDYIHPWHLLISITFQSHIHIYDNTINGTPTSHYHQIHITILILACSTISYVTNIISLNIRESVIYLFVHIPWQCTIYICLCVLLFVFLQSCGSLLFYSFHARRNKLWNWPRSLCSTTNYIHPWQYDDRIQNVHIFCGSVYF